MTRNNYRIGAQLTTILVVTLSPLGGYRTSGFEQVPKKVAVDADKRISSSVERTEAGELMLVERVRIAAPIEAVWNAYTTPEGYASWAAPVAKVDLKAGGTIRTHYDPKAKIGDPQTITLHIVNYVPKKLLTLQTDPTENWLDILREHAEHLYNVILFERHDDNNTEIVSYGLGYGDTPEMRRMLEFFMKGNEGLYRKLIAALGDE